MSDEEVDTGYKADEEARLLPGETEKKKSTATVYNIPGAIFHLFMGLVFSIIIFIPFWSHQYAPVIMAAPFQPTFIMLGLYCVSASHRGTSYYGSHIFFSMLSFSFLWVFIAEYLKTPGYTIWSGVYCYPAIQGNCESVPPPRVLVNTTYGTELPDDTDFPPILQSAWTAILIVVIFMLVLSGINIILSGIAIGNLPKFAKKRGKKVAPIDGMSCLSMQSITVVTISAICICIILIGMAQWILGIVMLTQSVPHLSPIYQNTGLCLLVASALVFVPVGCDETEHRKKKKQSDPALNYRFDEKSLQHVLASFYLVWIIVAIVFGAVGLSEQADWMHDNGLSIVSLYDTSKNASEILTFKDSNNVASIQYLNATNYEPLHVETRDQFAIMNSWLACLDMAIIIGTIILIFPYSIYFAYNMKAPGTS